VDQNHTILESPEYDYVIYTHGYCEKTIPEFKNKKNFKGEIYHTFSVSQELLDKLIAQNKKIILIGGSKSATDLILKFQDYAYKIAWLVRKPYWFFDYSLRKKWLKQNKNFLYHKAIFLTGLFLSSQIPALSLRIWSWFHLIKTYGKKPHHDFKKFHFGMIDKTQFKKIDEYFQDNGTEGDIAELVADGVILTNGKFIKADTIICCTGSGPTAVGVDLEIDSKQFNTETINKVYRSKVIPELPNLIFTAYHQFSIGTVDGLLQGNWIHAYIQAQPSKADLYRNLTLFSKPFFAKPALFDSGDYLIKSISKMYYPFFSNKEIKTLPFLKWFLATTFNGSKKIVPFDFNPLDISKEQKTKSPLLLIKFFRNFLMP
ncbi:MAG: hypothetical protein JSR33_07330, partial [Proteobacteria bacterium]|nr:hypothetical protein [Pseudomonadota bacterium]